jgi:twitching motility protein PilJ
VDGTAIPGGSSAVADELAVVTELWQKTDKDAANLIEQEKNLASLGKAVNTINTKNPQLLELSEQVAALKLQGGASAREIAVANQVVMLTQRIAKNANALLVANAIDPEVAFLLGKDTNTFRDLIEQLQKMTADGSDAKGKLAELEASARTTWRPSPPSWAASSAWSRQSRLATRSSRTPAPLLEKTTALAEGYTRAYTGFFTWVSLAIVLCALATLA